MGVSFTTKSERKQAAPSPPDPVAFPGDHAQVTKDRAGGGDKVVVHTELLHDGILGEDVLRTRLLDARPTDELCGLPDSLLWSGRVSSACRLGGKWVGKGGQGRDRFPFPFRT